MLDYGFLFTLESTELLQLYRLGNFKLFNHLLMIRLLVENPERFLGCVDGQFKDLLGPETLKLFI